MPSRLLGMYRHATEVLPEQIGVLTVDPAAPGTGFHLTFDQILGRCGQAWMAFLADLGPDLFGVGVIARRIDVVYDREVGVGPLEVLVETVATGRSSFTLRLDVRQAGERAAVAEAVLLRFDYDARRPLSLSDEQRTALEAHLPRDA